MIAPILGRLGVLYGQPDTGDPMAWFAEVTRLVSGYSDAEQDRAFDLISRTYRGRTYPSVSVIVTACADAREFMNPPKPDAPKYPDWSSSAIAKADQLIRTDVGRILAKEGCALGLHDFLRKHGRLPTQGEISAIRAETRQFDEAYEKCISGAAGPLSKSLEKIGDSMIERRNEVEDIALSGEKKTA